MLTGSPPEISRVDPDALFAGLTNARGLLLAVSGGPDSVALLLLVDRWREGRPVAVSVATVDHGLRPESAAEVVLVAALCAERGLPHRTLLWSGQKPTTGMAEAARDARYALLAAHAAEIGADVVVTAHHADDQAETILMRLLRGSGPAGLAGMARVSHRGNLTLARPLLDLPKATLVAICHAEGVGYVLDPSNERETARRTQIRRLLPLFAAEGFDTDAILTLGRRVARMDDAVDWALALIRESVAAGTLDLASLPRELLIRHVAAEIVRAAPAGRPRLERLERLCERITVALAKNLDFKGTLGGCLVQLCEGKLAVSVAPPRRRGKATSTLSGPSPWQRHDRSLD